jgi:hypothetical protein
MFINLSSLLLKSNSLLGYIIPSTWLYMNQFQYFRFQIISTFEIPEIILYRNPIFEDATVETCVTFLKNKIPTESSLYTYKEFIDFNNSTFEVVNQIFLKNDKNTSLLLKNKIDAEIFDRIKNENKSLSNYSKIVCGLSPYRLGKGKPKQSIEVVNGRLFDSDYKKDDSYRKYLMGRDFTKYAFQIEKERWISYGDWLAEPRYAAPFDDPVKIIVRQTSDKLIAHIDYEKFLSLKNVHNIKIIDSSIDYKFILGLINSKLLDWWYQKLIPEKGRVFAEVKVVNLNKLPIKKVNIELQSPFIDKIDLMLSMNNKFQNIVNKFSTYFSKQYNLDKLSGKLEKWYELSFVDFIKEINKAIKAVKGTPLTKKDEFEWMDLFEENKKNALEIKAEIDKTDKEIDQMVYALYGLTEEEIKIICDATS